MDKTLGRAAAARAEAATAADVARTASLMTREDCAARASVSVRTIDRHRTEGKLPFHKIGRAVRITPEDFATWLSRHQANLVLAVTVAAVLYSLCVILCLLPFDAVHDVFHHCPLRPR